MLTIKTQEDEIIFNPARIYAISNYGDYKVVAVDAHKKEHILGIYPTFKRANEEVYCIFRLLMHKQNPSLMLCRRVTNDV